MSQSKIAIKTKNIILPETEGLKYFRKALLHEKGKFFGIFKF